MKHFIHIPFKFQRIPKITDLRVSPAAENEERVLYAGLPEYEMEQESNKLGVPLLKKTFDNICKIGREYNVSFDKY